MADATPDETPEEAPAAPEAATELATFGTVFPDFTVWSTNHVSPGYDLVLVARPDGLQIDVHDLEDRMARDDHQRVGESLGAIGIQSVEDVLSAFAGRGQELRPWLADGVLNLDRNLRLMYLAGLGLNADESASIHSEIFSFRAWPEGLIVGASERIEQLRTMVVGGIT